MTREEAVKLLQVTRLMLMDGANQPISDLYYALDMAIEALEQTEPQTIVMVKDHGRKQALEMIDSYHKLKTENCSEKPNNSTTEDCSTVETDINVGRKDEPQKKEVEWVYNKRERLWYPYSNGELLFKDEPKTQMKTQNSNLTFEKHTMRDCYNCKKYETEEECIECHYEPKTEPQTEREGE